VLSFLVASVQEEQGSWDFFFVVFAVVVVFGCLCLLTKKKVGGSSRLNNGIHLEQLPQ
jgi:hypothetical protein